MKDNRTPRINIGWVIARLCVLVAAIVLFNFFPQWVGVWKSAADPDSFVPLLAPDFAANMPWLNLWWGLALALEVAHLGLRRWLPPTRWADLALSVLAGLILLQVMLQGPILVHPASAAATWHQFMALPPNWEQNGLVLLDVLLRAGLALVILGIAVDARRKLHLCTAGQQEAVPAR